MDNIDVTVKNTKNIRIGLIIIFLLVFGGIVFFLFGNLKTPTQYQGGKIAGKPAPSIQLTSMIDKKTYSIYDLKGKTVFVNFFNTWCIPCKEEEPVLEDFIAANKDNPDFIFISIARQDSKDNINKWISEKNPTQDVVFDGGEISLAFGVTGQPETFAIGKDGIVSSTLLARASQKSLNEMLSASS